MISIYEGKPGQGKTLYGVHSIMNALNDKKTYVASNIELHFKENDKRQERFKLLSLSTTIEDIIGLDLPTIYGSMGFQRILLVIDEVQMNNPLYCVPSAYGNQ